MEWIIIYPIGFFELAKPVVKVIDRPCGHADIRSQSGSGAIIGLFS